MPNPDTPPPIPKVALSHPILRNFECLSSDPQKVRMLCECLARNRGVAGAPVILDFYIQHGLVPRDMRDDLLRLWSKNEAVVEEIRAGLLEAFVSVEPLSCCLKACWIQDPSVAGVRVFSHKRPEAVWLMLLTRPVPPPTALGKTYVAEYRGEIQALLDHLKTYADAISGRPARD